MITTRRSILIIGPNSRATTGGVVQHLNNICALDVLKDAKVYDPGSLDKHRPLNALAVMHKCLFISSQASLSSVDQIWINASMYPTAIIKLFLLLIGLRLRYRGKVFVFFHGGNLDSIKAFDNRIARLICSKALQSINNVYFLAENHISSFVRIFPELKSRAQLFSNYLPHDTAPDRTRTSNPTFLFVGRLEGVKGVNEIATALRMLSTTPYSDRVHLRIAGDGSLATLLEGTAKELPHGMLTLLGRLTQEELEVEYRNASVLILPSRNEGLPYVVLEAIRFGLALLTTTSGRMIDINTDGVNGVVVPFGSPDAIAKAMKLFLDNPTMSQEMGKVNQQLFLDHFSKSAAEGYYGGLIHG